MPEGANVTDATDELLVEHIDGVAVLTLNRPKARNSLTAALIRRLRAELAAADADDTVGAVVLTGAGRAFCAGLDLGELAGSGENFRLAQAAPGDGPTPPGFPWEPLGKPLIGAVNGPAITGGFELALHCDILVASELAVFADTHLRVGLLPSWGMSVLLPRAVGARAALRLSLTGEFLDAPTALRAGLVSEVVAPDDLLKAALDVGRAVLAADPAAAAAFLASVRAMADVDTQAAFAAEAAASVKWNESGFDPAVVAARRAAVTAGNRGKLAGAPAPAAAGGTGRS